MNDFLNSKFVADLEDGKLPPVSVELDMLSVLMLCVGLFVSAILVVKVSKMM
jgi:hypothetical protein